VKTIRIISILLAITLVISLSSVCWAIKDKALMLYFSFDTATGKTVSDMTGNKHDGTLNNVNIIKDPVKIGKGALQVEDQNGVMTVDTFKELEEYQDNTFVFWLYFTAGSNGSWSQIVAKLAPGSDRSPGVWINPGGTGIHYRYNPGNLGFGQIGPAGEGSNFELKKWYHIACVKKSASQDMYINGEKKGTTAVPANHSQGPEKLYVGKSPTYRAATFIIDDLAIYNRALTDKEVKADMEKGVLPQAVDAEGKLTTTWSSIKASY